MNVGRTPRVTLGAVAVNFVPSLVVLAVFFGTRRAHIWSPETRVAFAAIFAFAYYFVVGAVGGLRSSGVTYASKADAFWGALRPAVAAGLWMVAMEWLL